MEDNSINASSDLPGSECDLLLESLILVAKAEGVICSRTSLTAGLPLHEGRLTPELTVRSALRAGLQAQIFERKLDDISALLMPVILILEDNKAVVLNGVSEDESGGRCYQITQADSGEQSTCTLADLEKTYAGFVIYVKPSEDVEERLEAGLDDDNNWFWPVLGRSWKIYRDVLLASLLVNLFVLANPLFVMNVYDRVVPNNAIETLWALAIGIIVLYCFDFILKYLRVYFIEVAGKKSDILLSTYIFEKVLGATFSSHPKSVGAFASQMRDFESVRVFITSATVTTVVDLPFVVLFLIAIGYIGGSIVWVPITAIPCILLYSWYIHRHLKKLVSNTFIASAQKNATLVEAISNLETLKILCAESRMLRKWEAAVGSLAYWGIKSRVASSSATNFAGFVLQISSVFVVVVGVYGIADNNLTQGGLIASVILTARALAPLAQVSGLLVQYHQSRIALDSLNNIVNREQERPEHRRFIERTSFTGAIEFKGVNFSYPEEEQASLREISLKINPGEKIGIIGRIGSGKSTLAKLLMGLYRVDSGSVLVDGIDITQIDPANLRTHIGYVPQDSVLFYGTLRENIAFRHNTISDEAVIKAADIAGVSEFVNNHPQGFERMVSERGESLSGGQRQAINVARSLVNEPPILLLDEPSTAMDFSSEARLVSNLRTHMHDKTLVLVTHKAALLNLVDRIVVLDQGKVIADGPKDTVLEALKKGHLRIT